MVNLKGTAHAAAHTSQATSSVGLSSDEIKSLWVKCKQCGVIASKTILSDNFMVCLDCGYHCQIGAHTRIKQVSDHFEELFADLKPEDPLQFFDQETYLKRQQQASEKSELNESLICGIASIQNCKFALAVCDFSYMGGSFGVVMGEKLLHLIEHATAQRLSLVIISSSGGCRMQEGVFSLMQMARVTAAVNRFHKSGLFYISVLSDPVFGGVTASYASLGDIIIAEPAARIGFAGRRVIEQTVGQVLPDNFQTAEYLLEHGQLDQIVFRQELKGLFYKLISLHTIKSPKNTINRDA